MKCGVDRKVCHIVLEAKVDDRWVVLDPLFNQSFRRPDGQLASFAEVSADWEHYQEQIPTWRRELTPTDEQFYDTAVFNYAGARYTHWEKIPVLLPAVRAVLRLWLGEERVQHLSIRSYLVDTNRVWCVIVLTIYAGLWVVTGVRLGGRQRATRLARVAHSETWSAPG